VRQLPDHLSAGAVLNQQRVFAGDLAAPRDVRYFYKQCGTAVVYGRHAAVDAALARVYLGWTKAQFVCVVITSVNCATQDVAKFGLIIHEAQKRLTVGAARANSENIFSRRIQTDDKKTCIEQNYAAAETVQNFFGVIVEGAVVTRTSR
jgi:hypothetical protein